LQKKILFPSLLLPWRALQTHLSTSASQDLSTMR